MCDSCFLNVELFTLFENTLVNCKLLQALGISLVVYAWVWCLAYCFYVHTR